MNLDLSVILPDRVFLKENVKEIVLPTLTGQMGVLKDHIPLLTGLDTGLIIFRKDLTGGWIVLVVAGGFALVNNNVVTVLVTEAELGSQINKLTVDKEFQEAKASLEKQLDARKKIEVLSQYKKARAKVQAVQQFL